MNLVSISKLSLNRSNLRCSGARRRRSENAQGQRSENYLRVFALSRYVEDRMALTEHHMN